MELIRTDNVNRTERPNSFEFGKAGQRHKIYYEDEADLKKRIDVSLKGEQYLADKLSVEEKEQ